MTITASNSSEAWSNLKKHQGINLVIYDVNCMDYSLFLDSLMFDENFKNLKVIIVTDNDFESKSKALAIGAIDYIRNRYMLVRYKLELSCIMPY